MEGLSPRQQEVYDCIKTYHDENGISPSMADIAEKIGLSTSTVATYIETLRKKKRLTSLAGVPRSFRVISA